MYVLIFETPVLFTFIESKHSSAGSCQKYETFISISLLTQLLVIFNN